MFCFVRCIYRRFWSHTSGAGDLGGVKNDDAIHMHIWSHHNVASFSVGYGEALSTMKNKIIVVLITQVCIYNALCVLSVLHDSE